jgi:hypothetical protein
VGIGIAGEEGMQAVMSSDYAIAQFSYLERLLLVHGRLSYVRTAKITLLSFCKNVSFVLVAFWFQMYCAFTAQYTYDYMYLLYFNMFFTMLPVLLLGVFDQQIGHDKLQQVPQLYRAGIRQQYYSMQLFMAYSLVAIYQSLVCYFVPQLVFTDTAVISSGFPENKTLIGNAQAFAIIATINCFTAAHMEHWNGFFVAGLVATWLVFLAFVLVYELVPLSEMYASWGDFGTVPFWGALVLTFVAASVPTLLFPFVRGWIWPKQPTDMEIIREIESVTAKAGGAGDGGDGGDLPVDAGDLPVDAGDLPADVDAEGAESDENGNNNMLNKNLNMNMNLNMNKNLNKNLNTNNNNNRLCDKSCLPAAARGRRSDVEAQKRAGLMNDLMETVRRDRERAAGPAGGEAVGGGPPNWTQRGHRDVSVPLRALPVLRAEGAVRLRTLTASSCEFVAPDMDADGVMHDVRLGGDGDSPGAARVGGLKGLLGRSGTLKRLTKTFKMFNLRTGRMEKLSGFAFSQDSGAGRTISTTQSDTREGREGSVQEGCLNAQAQRDGEQDFIARPEAALIKK